MCRRAALVAVLAITALATALTPVGAADPDAHFVDVERDRWFTDAIDRAQTEGVVGGVTPECFLPERTATRAEVAAVLQRMLAPDATATDHGFTDVTAGWQQVPVTWMVDRQATTGTSPTTFSPEVPATRAMVAAFLWRLSGEPGVTIFHPFTDVPRSGWQFVPVSWMWERGHTTGTAPTTFSPDEPVTRAELLTFVHRWRGEPAPAHDLATPDPGPDELDCLVQTRTCADVFDAAAVAEITAAAAGRAVTAHVHDHRTGCAYELNPGVAVTTASVIKAQVLAGVLLDAQERGAPVSDADAARIERMIRFSHNSPPTSELYLAVGGAAGMEALDTRFGLTNTSHTALYGATRSTAADRTRLVEQLLVGDGPLDAVRVEEAWAWMSNVTPAQTWGITAGLPADHEVALKNGFYPMSGRGWRLGSSGVVRVPGPNEGTIAMTVMTEFNANEADGIALVELVAAHVNEHLTVGDPAPRAVAAVTCVQTSGADTWTSAADALGGVDPESLRHVNGGEAGPLSGQRVCAP